MPARISIDGNLVADPDFGVGDTGASWAHLRVASHEWVRRDGDWVSTEAEYYNITLFGLAAAAAANDLHKGDRVTVQGRPELETFDRRDGTPRRRREGLRPRHHPHLRPANGGGAR